MNGPGIASIIRHYRRHQDEADEACGYRFTPLGAWASSRAPHVFAFFRKVRLERYRLFLDLGSGDGLVTCIAGLFTRAVGIEIDRDLCRTAREAARHLLLEKVDFVCGDYLSMRIARADCLYVYPDKPLGRIEEQLSGWGGTLLVYGPHFPLKHFPPVQHLRCARERMTVYGHFPGN